MKVKRMIKSDVDTFKVGDIIKGQTHGRCEGAGYGYAAGRGQHDFLPG